MDESDRSILIKILIIIFFLLRITDHYEVNRGGFCFIENEACNTWLQLHGTKKEPNSFIRLNKRKVKSNYDIGIIPLRNDKTFKVYTFLKCILYPLVKVKVNTTSILCMLILTDSNIRLLFYKPSLG